MSKKERSRLVVVSRVKEKQMTIKEASELLGISYRQCQRIYKRYVEAGDKGLLHRNRGRPSNRRKPAEVTEWKGQRKRPQHRKWRGRKAHFGELVQMDGSHHTWLDGQEDRACLMDMVDDATGKTLALMSQEETTVAAMRVLWAWVERYGIPKTLYVDWKNVYITQREPTLEEQLSGELPLTQFGRACKKLGIEILPASSPQAKGRVERKHGTL